MKTEQELTKNETKQKMLKNSPKTISTVVWQCLNYFAVRCRTFCGPEEMMIFNIYKDEHGNTVFIFLIL